MSSRADFALAGEAPQHFGVEAALGYIWDVPTLSWVKDTGSGGGGGGAVTIADGADVAEGSTGDAAWVAGAGTVISLLKAIASGGGGLTDAQLRAFPVPISIDGGTFGVGGGFFVDLVEVGTSAISLGQKTSANSFPVVLANDQSAVPVSTKTDLTPSAPAVASVGVASAQAVAANAARKGLILVNVSNARISLGFGSAAVLDSGATLYPGGTFEMDEGCFDLGAVNAIASAAASPLGIQEYVT